MVLLASAPGCDRLSARQKAKQAAELYAQGDYAGAATLYREAAALEPDLEVLELNLAFTHLQLLKSASKSEHETHARQAIDALIRYEKRSPDDGRARKYLLQTFVDGLRYEDAQRYFEPELSRTPPSVEAIAVLGQIAAKRGDFDGARAWCARRAEATPNDPAAHQCLGNLVWSHLHKHPEVVGAARFELADLGLGALNKAASLAPEAPETYVFMNLIHRERALAHPCGEGFDAGLDDRGKGVDAGIDEQACEAAKAADIAAAVRFQAMAKERSAAPAPDGGS